MPSSMLPNMLPCFDVLVGNMGVVYLLKGPYHFSRIKKALSVNIVFNLGIYHHHTFHVYTIS